MLLTLSLSGVFFLRATEPFVNKHKLSDDVTEDRRDRRGMHTHTHTDREKETDREMMMLLFLRMIRTN